jgi:hypothetical protein
VIQLSKIFPVLVSALILFSFAGATYSAEKGEKMMVAAGKVTAINAQEKTITIRNDKVPVFTCFFNSNTTVRSNMGTMIVATDIKMGSIVAIAYEKLDGKNIARGITVAIPPR